MVVLRFTLIAVLVTAILLFSGFSILHPVAAQQFTQPVAFTFNGTAGEPITVHMAGQTVLGTGHVSVHAPPGTYAYSAVTPYHTFKALASSTSGAPWWVYVGEGAAAGAAVGDMTFGPVGAIGGTLAGATVGAILLYWFSHQSSGIKGTNETPTMQALVQGIQNTMGFQMQSDSAIASLTNTSYYYFAQEMESEAVRYINTSLNLSQLAIMSGVLNQVTTLYDLLLSPICWEYLSLYNWALASQAGTASSMEQALGSSVALAGNALTAGDYYYLINNTTFFHVGNSTLKWYNPFTKQTRWQNLTATPTTTTEAYEMSSSATNSEVNQNGTINEILPSFQTWPGPGGAYHQALAVTTNETGLWQLAKVNTTSPSEAYTDALPLGTTWNLAIKAPATPPTDWLFSQMETVGTNIIGFVNAVALAPGGTFSVYKNLHLEYVTSLEYLNSYRYEINTDFLSTAVDSLNNTLSNAYASAEDYLAELRQFGYTNYTQIPANETIPFPSWFVPANVLNGSLNQTWLFDIYMLYMESLNNTFYAHGKHIIPKGWTFNNSSWDGMVIESGTLNLSNSYNGYKEINGTFAVQLDTGSLSLRVGETTKLTSQTPVYVINGTAGDPVNISGALVEAQPNSTLYVSAITVNGTSVNSYTLSAQQIHVWFYVPKPFASVNTTAPLAWYQQSLGGLPAWAWAVFGVLAIVVVAAAERKRK